MSSVSTAFKVHYSQKLGTHPTILGGTHHGLWGIDAPVTSCMVLWENNNSSCTRIDDILQNAWEIFTKFWSAAYLVQFRTVVTLRSKGQSQVHNETKYSQKSLVQKLISPAKACHHRSKLTAREHVWTSYSSSLTYYIYLLTSLLIIANIRHVASSCT